MSSLAAINRPEQSAARSQVLRPDPAMAGFEAALDTSIMPELVTAHLLGDTATCTGVRIVRFRHRPGERLVVVYQADIASNGTTLSRPHIVLTGRIHPGRARPTSAARDRHASRGIGSKSENTALPRQAYIPELGMTLDVFPHDRRLPALRELFEEPAAALSRLFCDTLLSTSSGRHGIAMELMRYRPGLSATLRLRVAAADERGCNDIYVKACSDCDLVDEVQTVSRVNTALEKSCARLRLATPVAINSPARVAVYQGARGQTMQELLLAGRSPAVLGSQTGEALAHLHTLGLCLPQGRFDSGLAEKIERAERIVSWAVPTMAARARELSVLAHALTASPLAMPTHRDMKPDHVFLDNEDRVEFIDCGSLCAGNPLADIGSLLARLDLLALMKQLSDEVADEAKAAILASYIGHVPAMWERHLGPASAYGALLVATHAIQGLMPNWQTIVAAMMENGGRMVP